MNQTEQTIQAAVLAVRDLRLTAGERDVVNNVVNALVSEIAFLSKQQVAPVVVPDYSPPPP